MLKQIGAPSPKPLATSQDATPNRGLPSGLSQPGFPILKAGQLFGCYRKGDANDPDVYTVAVAAIFAEYPPEIVDYVCDPRTGLPRRLKWLPTIAEIAEACDLRMEYAKAVAYLRQIAAQKQAIIADQGASESAKAAAQSWLDNCKSLKQIGE
jgi:hypothetical protein